MVDLKKTQAGEGAIIRFGRFRNARTLENVVTPILMGVTALLSTVVVIWAESGELFNDIAARIGGARAEGQLMLAELFALPALAALACFTAFYTHGKTWKWQTTEEALILTRGKETVYYYYSEIWDVNFERFGIRGGRGWAVTIKTEYRLETWRLIIEKHSGGYAQFEDTPFFLLMQNCGLAEKNIPKRSLDDISDIELAAMFRAGRNDED